MKIFNIDFKKEWTDFYLILWDQIILSIFFTILIYLTKEDYNFEFKPTDTEYFKLWK